MLKRSLPARALTSLFAAITVIGIYSCSSIETEKRTINLSAFKNASKNLQFLAKEKHQQEITKYENINASIIRVIEKEVRGKIYTTRVALAPKKPESAKEVVVKNWNDIKPSFDSVELKSATVLPRLKLNEEDLVNYEINNSELIQLSGMSSEEISYNDFASMSFQSYEMSEQKTDTVTISQASGQKNVVTDDHSDQAELSDDLVMFEYDSGTATPDAIEDVLVNEQPKKIFDTSISQSVKHAIERELKEIPTKVTVVGQKNTITNETAKAETLQNVIEDEDSLVFDYSSQSQAAVVKNSETLEESGFIADSVAPSIKASFVIKAQEINLSTRRVDNASGFEFVPDYDRSERLDDQTTGEIVLGYSLASDVNTQTGVLQSHGMIPTRVELNLLNKGINVPLLSEEGVQQFLKNKQTDVAGNLLMFAIDGSIVDVETDSTYAYKLYFDKKFQMLESQNNASFVLFLGVRSGNIGIRYLLSNNEKAHKIIYVGDGELHFEDPDFVSGQRELFTFTTRNLLSTKAKELNIDASYITLYGSNAKAKKKTLNAYEIKVPESVKDNRKYLEFKHLGSSLYVGTKDTKEIEIPGRDFISKVLHANELSELGTRCLVQINLTKDLRDIKANGKNSAGEMFTETSFLDGDGNFSRDNLELSQKVFLTGDQEGIFSVRLDYTDGTSDFLKTFCSEGSYLVEQL